MAPLKLNKYRLVDKVYRLMLEFRLLCNQHKESCYRNKSTKDKLRETKKEIILSIRAK